MSEKKLAIGIACYPTYGGSGVVATEVGMEMARRGHRVHVMSYDVPRRLNQFMENVFFHEVEISPYPVFDHPPYTLALASKIFEVSEQQQLDIVHVHYAIPHAVSAYLAVQMLGSRAPKVITTLHGTDITLVGNNRSYLAITRHSIVESDGVTAVSRFLKQATYDKLNLPATKPIEVIPNFIDPNEFANPGERSNIIRKYVCEKGGCGKKPLLCHVSNFRPVKRIPDVIKVFAEVRKQVECGLVLVGDGPERSNVEQLVRELGLADEVCFLGKQNAVNEVLWSADLFLMPSQTESFGLGALEAMACGVPVIATNVGGLPEVLQNGVQGYLCDIGDVPTMAARAVELLRDDRRRREMGDRARERAVKDFGMEKVVTHYEQFYLRTLGA